jgi:hypothetical protein
MLRVTRGASRGLGWQLVRSLAVAAKPSEATVVSGAESASKRVAIFQ